MPQHDPIPTVRPAERVEMWLRFRRMMGWMAIAAVVAVLLALIYLKSGGPVTVHMYIATVLGVGLSMLVGTALMALVFLSNRSGHDEEAAGGGQAGDDEVG